MRVTVIHNRGAGDESHSAAELLAELRAMGHALSYASTKQDWRAAVQDPGDLVIAAGGDGTVAKVARELVGRRVPVAILPLGTANNFARSLGGRARTPGPPDQRFGWRNQLQALFSWPTRNADVGVSRGPWGERTFIEGAGFGVLADAMSDDSVRDTEPPANSSTLRRDAAHVLDHARRAGARRYSIECDGEKLDAEAILVTVLNASSIGPQLELAADATPFDGVLHLVVAGEDDRPALDRYLAGRAADRREPLCLTTRTARRITITWHEDVKLHVDDKSWLGRRCESALFEIWPASLPLLVPPD